MLWKQRNKSNGYSRCPWAVQVSDDMTDKYGEIGTHMGIA